MSKEEPGDEVVEAGEGEGVGVTGGVGVGAGGGARVVVGGGGGAGPPTGVHSQGVWNCGGSFQ